MPKILFKASNVFNDIAKLISLLRSLNKSKTNIHIEGLDALESEILRRPPRQDYWKLATKLTFKYINKEDLNLPPEIALNVSDILLELKVLISENSYSVDSICDCIEQSERVRYGINLITYGKTTDNTKTYKMSWHLDKHIRNAERDDDRGRGFLHPEYHFNMGGFALSKDTGFNFGNILLIDTPRIIHPPMDTVLSIDFVLKNFYGIRVKNLTDSRQYNRIIFNAKRRLWRPYFISLANHWEGPRFNDLTIQKDYASMILGDT